MSKQKKEERVLRGIRPLMAPGESLEGVVEAIAGPWQYLTLTFLLGAFALNLSGYPDLGLLAMLMGLICSLRMKPHAVVVTSDALYVGRLRWRRDLEDPEVLKPLSSLDYERFLPRMRLGSSHYWVTPPYLGEDTTEFERSLRASKAAVAPAETIATGSPVRS